MTSAQDNATQNGQGNGTTEAGRLDPKELLKALNDTYGQGNGQAAPAEQAPESTETGVQFKVGWSYDVYLRKNKLAPSEAAGITWKRLSREASKLQVSRMAQLTDKGFKTTCKRSAIWNGKAKTWDTALTARVVEPDCQDADLIRDAYVKAQAKMAKSLSAMRAAAVDQGADIGE